MHFTMLKYFLFIKYFSLEMVDFFNIYLECSNNTRFITYGITILSKLLNI